MQLGSTVWAENATGTSFWRLWTSVSVGKTPLARATMPKEPIGQSSHARTISTSVLPLHRSARASMPARSQHPCYDLSIHTGTMITSTLPACASGQGIPACTTTITCMLPVRALARRQQDAEESCQYYAKTPNQQKGASCEVSSRNDEIGIAFGFPTEASQPCKTLTLAKSRVRFQRGERF